jgi:hypothetical protein
VVATKDDITLLLQRMDDGKPGAMDELMRIVYSDTCADSSASAPGRSRSSLPRS